MSRQKLVIFVPELFRNAGGIQNFSRSLIAACDDVLGERVAVITRNDRLEDVPAEFQAGRDLRCLGWLPARLRSTGFVAMSLAFRHHNVLSTHPGFVRWLWLLRKLGQGEYCTIAHGIEVWGNWSPSFRRGMSQSARILAVSRFTRESVLAHLDGAAPPIDVFPNTIDTSRFHPAPADARVRRRWQIEPDAQVMLTVARLSKSEHRKQYRMILEQLPDLVVEFPRLVWVLAGHGNDLEDLRQEAKRLGVESHCRFTGFVLDEQLPELYRAADVFVLPSKKEGFGIVFLEAIASGLPVIAGNQDGSVDALRDGELGLLVNPDQPDEILQALRRILRGDVPPHLRSGTVLHRRCEEVFGRVAFQERLRHCLTEMGWMSH
jgi:phosphatidyl-myo-inositol dimannoside synthase